MKKNTTKNIKLLPESKETEMIIDERAKIDRLIFETGEQKGKQNLWDDVKKLGLYNFIRMKKIEEIKTKHNLK